MRTKTTTLLSGLYHPAPKINVWKWAESNVDFSLEPRYETPLHGAYSANFLPMWKEIQENFTDLAIREQWIIKNSRAGASENCLLNPLRYTVAVAPKSTQYISGDELSVKRFFDKRIKLGFGCSAATQAKYKDASTDAKYDIVFPDMDLVATWPKNKMAFKQTGYELILADEVSTWPSFSSDMMRKRTDTYRYSHICGLSSPDPQAKRSSDEDPIFIEFEGGDQRYWNMKDPKTGNRFKFAMGVSKGKEETVWGLKWPATCKNSNGEWDLDAVEKNAYYVTPDGTRINEKNRWKVVMTGRWVPENVDAPNGVRSYHINSFYMPFKSGSFGHIAKEFLKAKHKGAEALKIFVYEYLAEKCYETKVEATDDELSGREANYLRGARFSESADFKKQYEKLVKVRYLTVDVQKLHFWWLLREWVDGGDSGLMNFGHAATWQEIEDIANENEVQRVLVDAGYAERAMEVYEYCLEYQAWPTMGVTEKAIPFRKCLIDPFEGKRGQGENNIIQYTFNTDIFKMMLTNLVKGDSKEHHWYTYAHPERDYVRQVASERKRDGVWEMRPGHPHNHLWDCEVLQLLAATIEGVFRSKFDEK